MFDETQAQLVVNTVTLHQYKSYKHKKSTKKDSKRLPSKGRIFTYENAQEMLKNKAERERAKDDRNRHQRYLTGEYTPEIDVAREDIAVINPAEASYPYRPFCHVFWAHRQGVTLMDDVKWDHRNPLMGGGKWAYNTTLTNLTKAQIDDIKKLDHTES